MTKEMKKDNVIINADDKLAKELALYGYTEVTGKAVADEPGTQPNPYTEDEEKVVDKQIEINEIEQDAIEATAEKVEELEAEKEEIREEQKAAPKKTTGKK